MIRSLSHSLLMVIVHYSKLLRSSLELQRDAAQLPLAVSELSVGPQVASILGARHRDQNLHTGTLSHTLKSMFPLTCACSEVTLFSLSPSLRAWNLMGSPSSAQACLSSRSALTASVKYALDASFPASKTKGGVV